MKNLMNTALMALLLLGVQSCYYDNPPELVPFDCAEVSYVTHIQPIWEQSCISGCHNGSNYEPDLSAEVSWTELTGGYVNLAVIEESSLWKSVNFESNAMPPGGPKLSLQNLELIRCWLEEGAPNN